MTKLNYLINVNKPVIKLDIEVFIIFFAKSLKITKVALYITGKLHVVKHLMKTSNFS